MANKTSPIFRTKYDNDTDKFKSESGSKLIAKYALKIDPKTGYEYLAPTGEFDNVYDRIQADYPSTDINILMERFALGETEAIHIKEGFYADVTGMPKTYAELFQRYEDSKKFFEELPADLKEMFNNSYTEFWSEMDSSTKSFNEKIDKYNERFELSPEYDIDEKGVNNAGSDE